MFRFCSHMGARYDSIVIGLALAVLKGAAYRSSREKVACIEVRLALHVLRPYIGATDTLASFWSAAQQCGAHPWDHCHHHYRAVAEALREAGHDVAAD